MGNPLLVDASPRIHIYASSTSWIEESAIAQLRHLAARNGITAVAAMPDLHPGHHGPVGCAALAENIVHADVIGTDIGCGMQFWSLDMPERKLNLDKAATRFLALEGPWNGDALAELEKADVADNMFATSLGTIGGGNHFCELQAVDEIIDTDLAAQARIISGGLGLLVHSGSRGLGAMTLAKHYNSGVAGLEFMGGGQAYLADHNMALRFAKTNRSIIARRAMEALRVEGTAELDMPHNLVEVTDRGILHRKGCAPSNRGLVPIPGSRGAFTFLVMPLQAPPQALDSIAHGAGRKHDRGSMERRIRTAPGKVAELSRTAFGGRVICTDRKLLIEEAPEAYKDVRKVVHDLESLGLVKAVAIMRPLLTFKTARECRDSKRGQK